MINIAILASGNGSNAENIIRHFDGSDIVKIQCVISNNKEAKVLERASILGIESNYFQRKEFNETGGIINYLMDRKVELIVLAGFLQLIPKSLINQYVIINIHPALLPKYGGKGMYGDYIHKAVIENKETESGITIHKVSEKYDEGQILLQKKCEVVKADNYQTLAEKIHRLEYQFYPKVIEQIAIETEDTTNITCASKTK